MLKDDSFMNNINESQVAISSNGKLTITSKLENRTSLFSNFKTIETSEVITIKEYLNRIKIGKYKNIVLEAREIKKLKNDSEYTIFKSSKVPAISLSTYINHRIGESDNSLKKYGRKKLNDLLNNKLINHTGLLQIDIDKLSSSGSDLETVRKTINNDPFTVFSFVSISGDGIKAGIYIDGANHEEAFIKAEKYYIQKYNFKIDPSVKDLYRLCAISYDPELYINENAQLFNINDVKEIQPTNTLNRIEYSNKVYQDNGSKISLINKAKNSKLQLCISMLQKAPKGERHSTRMKVFYLAGGLLAGGLFNNGDIDILLKESDRIADGNQTNKSEMKSINDAINNGKQNPISQSIVIDNFENYLQNIGYYNKNHSTIHNNGKNDAIAADDDNDFCIIDHSTGVIIHSYKFNTGFLNKCLNENESGDAELFSKIYKNKKLYDFDSKEWFTYTNGVWQRDEIKETRKTAIETLTQVYTQLLINIELQIKELNHKAIEDDTNAGIKLNIEALKKLQKLVKNRIKRIQTASGINNILELATSFLAVTTKEFDSNPYYLNLTNGTYDLKSFQFKKHQAHDKLKKCTATNYDITKTNCMYWINFLNKIFREDQSLISFIQELCGIWLTGSSNLQYILFAYGSGANGKSTLFNTLQMLLNGYDDYGKIKDSGYFTRMKIETILFSKNQSSVVDYSLAKLQGARLVVFSEIPKGCRLNESLVKDLSGGETINARHPYGRPFEIYPTHSTVMFGNTKPFIKDASEGFWRRILLLPFEYTIPENERREMDDVLNEFKSELSGILNWCIAGLVRYKERGRLEIPEKVKVATNEYRIESDTLSEFLDLIKEDFSINKNNKTLHVQSSEFYEYFKKWCDADPLERDNKYSTLKSFNKALIELGFEVRKWTNNKSFIFGIKSNQQLL